ncbi:hypothetical protein C8R43DRAFT_1129562 [Mycena crocata]|nr:hypothetical protein C8R43DRAFT_1129562 [Mycena crocata]
MSAQASSSNLSSLNLFDPPILRGRRCWKRTKERTEAVWSPLLETVLIEALEKYRPTNSLRDPRLFRRFPKRNLFISDHIFNVTRVRRTAKQVGSRLQQMRDTCEDQRILDLLSRRDYCPEWDPTMELNTPLESSLSPLSVSSPVSPTSDFVNIGLSPLPTAGSPPRTFVTIKLVSPSASAPLSRKSIRGSVAPNPSEPNRHSLALEYPSEIENADPVLTFSTPQKIITSQHYSHFRVLVGGALVHSETTDLSYASTSSTPSKEQHTYNTRLIPHFWAQVSRSAQLFQCVIEQDILKTRAPFHALPTSPGVDDQSIRSVTYEFSLCQPAPAPVLYTPPLRSEPPLPPGFPRAGYRSRFSTGAPKPIEDYPRPSLRPAPMSSMSSPPAKYMLNEEYAAYGWHLDNSAPDGLFSGTSFYEPNGMYSNPPHYQSSNPPNAASYGAFTSAASNLTYNPHNTYDEAPSPIWSDASMYSEYNSGSF